MSGEILLSFVMPVYNVEKYLNECLDSVFDPSADEGEYEVIAVDDGSTDNSPEILKSYLRHKNFIIIPCGSGGPGGSRNTGIRAAKGKYIYFVDSDDKLLPGTVPILLGYARESDSDIIEFDGQTMDEAGRYIADWNSARDRIPYSGTGKDTFAVWLEKEVLSDVVWLRIVKRVFLIDNSLYFLEHIFQEDMEWVYRSFFYARTVVYHPKAIYSYRRRKDSASTEKNDIKRCFDFIAVIDSLAEFRNGIQRNEENMKYIRALGEAIALKLDTVINVFCKSSDLCEYRKVVFAELKKRRGLLAWATGRKGRHMYKLTRFMPASVAFRMYKIL